MANPKKLKTIFKPLVIVVAAVYFVIDALALSVLKPLLRKIANLRTGASTEAIKHIMEHSRHDREHQRHHARHPRYVAGGPPLYRMLGFEIIHGGEDAAFTSFRAGTSYLNLIAQPAERKWSWWGRVIFYHYDVDTLHARVVAAGYRPDMAPGDAKWGERFFHLTDPDGHELSYIGFTPSAIADLRLRLPPSGLFSAVVFYQARPLPYK